MSGANVFEAKFCRGTAILYKSYTRVIFLVRTLVYNTMKEILPRYNPFDSAFLISLLLQLILRVNSEQKICEVKEIPKCLKKECLMRVLSSRFPAL